MTTIRVALAEDNVLLREGVSRLVSAHPDFELAGTASDLPELLALIESAEPDVVITDIRMPPNNTDEGIQLAVELRDRQPDVGVVVLSQYSDHAYALALFDRGSDRRAYLLKERVHNRVELTAAIHAVAEGGSMIDPKIVEKLVQARGLVENSPLNDLTSREREVLTEIAQGKSNTAIAESLFLTKRAVEKHINAIFLKLGLADAEDVSKRVKAALMLLAETRDAADLPATPG